LQNISNTADWVTVSYHVETHSGGTFLPATPIATGMWRVDVSRETAERAEREIELYFDQYGTVVSQRGTFIQMRRTRQFGGVVKPHQITKPKVDWKKDGF